ncbi:MAG: sulfite exporter TauE/SafE family protein [Coriobacteriia bacterium]|nr:sulfite exporter TauE/SafE family protein [Coriobacteriia bacterium]
MDIYITITLFVLTGLLMGIASGLLGVGGGTILVPTFRILFGMSPLTATATSLCAIVPTSISGAAMRIRQKTCIVSLGIIAGLGGAISSPMGVWLATLSPPWLIMVVAAAVIAYSAISMFIKALRMKSKKHLVSEDGVEDAVEDAVEGGVEAQSMARAGKDISSSKTPHNADPAQAPTKAKLTKKQFALGFVIAFFAGVLAGYIGVGGGFIMIPLMVFFLRISLKEASGTSLIAMVILAIPGVVTQGVLGNIDYVAALVVVAGSIPGAFIGARLVEAIPERSLRFVFSAFLLLAAALLALNEFNVLG